MTFSNSSSELIFEAVKGAVVSVIRCPTEKIQLKTHLVDDLEADSLDLVTIFVELEEIFENDMPHDDAKSLLTVGAIVDFISAEINKK